VHAITPPSPMSVHVDPLTSTMSTTPSILAWLKRKTPARTVLITGASGGLGAYIAGAFDAAGARQIVLCGRDEAALQQTAASIVMARVEILIFDVTSEEAVEKALAHAWATFGGIDVLVNNAAILETPARIKDSQADEWWRVYETNLLGPYLTTRAFLKLHALDEGRPRRCIINISSTAAVLNLPKCSAYVGTKAALCSFTESTHNESYFDNVRTFAFHPGLLQTSMLTPSLRRYGDRHGFDEPQRAGWTCVYLSCPEADFLSGRFFSACWDLEHLQKQEDRIICDNLLKLNVYSIALPDRVKEQQK